MSIPVYQSFSVQKEPSTTSTTTIDRPAGVVEGNLMIAVVAKEGPYVDPSSSDGWINITTNTVEDRGNYIDVFYRIATDSEPADYTFTWNRNQQAISFIFRITGADGAVPILISDYNYGISSDPQCPSVNATEDDCLIFRFFSADEDKININSGYPSEHTGIIVDKSSSISGMSSAGAAYEEQASSGSTGTASFSMTASDDYEAITVVVQPIAPISPDPMTFSSVPEYVDSDSITMTASEAFHGEGVEYYFTNTAGGGNDSEWQDSRTYVDEGITPDTEYTYTVTARSKTSQDETAASDPASAFTLPATPNVPTNLAVDSTSNSILDLTWTDTNSSPQETGTLVERSPNGSSGWTEVADEGNNDVAFENTGLDSNTQYFYRIRTYIIGNEATAYSNYTSVVDNQTRPDNPTNLAATTIDYQQIDLDWDGEGSYKIERSTVGDFSGEEIEIISESDILSTSAYSDTDLDDDTFYYYKVISFNDGGDSADYTSIASDITDLEPPTDPSNLVATSVSNSRIDLTWLDNSNNPQEEAFEIWRSTTSAVAGFSLLATVATDTEAYSNTGLDSNNQYWYKVRGYVDSDTDSDLTSYSDYTNVADNWTRPVDPTDLLLFKSFVIVDVNLIWVGEGSYRIERSTTGSFSGEEVEVVSESDNLTTSAYIDTSVSANTIYYYRIIAYSDGGDSGYTAASSLLTLFDISVAPLVATKDETTGWSRINLVWVNPEESTDEYYFIIERMLDGAGDPDDANDAGWITLVDVSDLYDDDTYKDTDVSTNTKYYYQITVYSSNDSNYSLVSSDDATTDPDPEAPVANAGSDQTVVYADRVSIVLNGSGSTSEAAIANYIWRNNGASIAEGISPTIELPEGTHKITLAVCNEFGVDYDNVTVIVGLQPINILNLIPEKFR